MTGCPVSVKIPEFIKLITEGEFSAAARRIRRTNALPAICGRVCPQETQCEEKCILGKKGAAIQVGHLERFCSDWEREHEPIILPKLKPKNNKKVGVVGSGRQDLPQPGN